MGSRSRKRRRPDGARTATPAPPKATPEPEPALQPETPASPQQALRRGYARGRERDEIIRQGRKNLTVRTRAYVTKIVFAGKRAVGVVYRGHGDTPLPAGWKVEWSGFGDDAEAVVTDLAEGDDGAG